MCCPSLRLLIPVILSGLLGGCGLTVPNIAEVWDRDIPESPPPEASHKISATAQIEFEIVNKIHCDLQKAVHKALQYPVSAGATPTGKFTRLYPGLFPPNWAAQVALSLQVDEASGINPGVALNQVLPNSVHVFGLGTAGTVTSGQSFSLGFGGTASSTSTRTDKFNPYWSVADLSKPFERFSSCYPENDTFRRLNVTPATSSPIIVSELGIEDWLIGSMFVNDLIPSTPQPKTSKTSGGGQGGGPKPESISIEIKFIIVTTGNVTPTWKLVNVSANTGNAPFFSAGRTRTHDLIITIGPSNQQTLNNHLASQIGNAVSNSNRAPLLASPQFQILQ
jgi:hypothetical protein